MRRVTKTVPVETLVDLLFRLRRFMKVGLAHGCFNMIHAGHVRHFRAVKEQCEVLVVGITPDRFVAQRQRVQAAIVCMRQRLLVPEGLRAETVAALALVDYVVIDEPPHPAPLILALRPDVFAKGAEYEADPTPAVVEAKAAVESYGGRMLFTPGDVVFSVSALLEEYRGGAPPYRDPWEGHQNV